MATVSSFVKSTVATQGLGSVVQRFENLLNFATTNVASGDVVKALTIPADTLIVNVRVIVKTAVGSTCTATVGDGDGANSWDASTNLNASAGTVTAGASGTDTYATTGKLYTSADTIDLTMGNAAAAGACIVVAEGYKVETYS